MANSIIVTGANGQLGSCLRDIAPKYPTYKFVFTDIAELDITDEAAVEAFFSTQKPKWVINAAAYTAVDKAESQEQEARLLNATAVGVLARQSRRVDAGLVHVSTDYVFEGADPNPLTEDMPTKPQCVYGVTKLDGEGETAQNPKTIILRTSWLYSAYGNNFVKTMRRLGSEHEEIGVVSDQWGSPTSADDMAEGIMTAITKADRGADVYGLYHYSNQGVTCWADFAQQVMEYSGLSCRVKYITTSEYPTAAKRPEFSIMSKQKFETIFELQIPEWEDALERVISKLTK